MVENEYVYRTLAEGDQDAVRGLLKRCLLWTDWEWKYLHNPSFDTRLVAVAEENGKIVGCNHWLPRNIKLSSSSVCNAILCADIAVDPNHRKLGIGKSLLLFLRSSALSHDRGGTILNYMFTNPGLSKRLHQPTVGYVPIPTSTVTYCRRWSWKQFVRRVEEANVKIEPKGRFGRKGLKGNLKVVFHLFEGPPLTISLNQGRIEAFQGNVEDAVLEVKSDLASFARLKRQEKRTRALFKALLTGKLRVTGSLLGVFGLYRNVHLLEEIFRLLP